ncbi:MAG: response regulator [Desulfamplus sp.]|nr:response regulator [Desulfamplus sp.]
MKLLIADDSLLVRNTLKRLVNAMEIPEIELFQAGNGQEAIEKFKEEKPDALILDLLMPEVDGVGVLEHLKEKTHNCFISILSSNVQDPVKKRCMDMGAHIFIEKPITHEKMKYFFIKMEKWGGDHYAVP